MKLPFDGVRTEQLFRMISKGLANWNRHLDLPDEECIVMPSFLSSAGENMFQGLLAMNARTLVEGNLGDGIFIYRGLQAVDDPRLTVWSMSIYGAVVGDDPKVPAEKCVVVYAITAPKCMPAASELARLIQPTH